MQSAKESGIKVVLDGQGGDELFAGYQHHYLKHWKELIAAKGWPAALKEMKNKNSLTGISGKYFKNYLKEKLLKQMPASVQMKANLSYFNDLNYLNADLLNQHQAQLAYTKPEDITSLNGMLAGEFYNTRLKTYLKCEDRCSMWHSVESRTPFADDINLIEYGFQIPGAYKIHQGITKFILREAGQNYIPAAIKNRKDKLGYSIPHNQWVTDIKDTLQPIFDDTLKDYMDVKALQKDYNKLFNIAGKPEDSRVFKFISFAIWKKQYNL